MSFVGLSLLKDPTPPPLEFIVEEAGAPRAVLLLNPLRSTPRPPLAAVACG